MSALSVAQHLLHPSWFAARHVVLFEDAESTGRLYPLNVLRPAWELRCGLGCLREWIAEYRKAGITVALRPRAEMGLRAAELAGFDDPWASSEEDVVFLNGRVLRLPPCAGAVPGAVVDANGRVLWARLSGKRVLDFGEMTGTLLAETLVKQVSDAASAAATAVVAADYVWDFMAHNGHLLRAGFAAPAGDRLLESSRLTELQPGVSQYGAHPVYAGEGTRLLPHVVLDTTEGPILLGKDVQIEPHCYLKGPLALGDHGRVKAGAALYSESSFGPHCRVAGEISGSILQGYVNKQHAGYLGNSHLGEWVNLGADTTVSNLRNDYGNVKVKLQQKLVDSGRQFVGLLCGDHTKTGINTMFNTGTVVGVAANVHGEGYPPRSIRSFGWGGKSGLKPEPLERALETARLVMSRRGRELGTAEIELLNRHYEEVVNQENQG